MNIIKKLIDRSTQQTQIVFKPIAFVTRLPTPAPTANTPITAKYVRAFFKTALSLVRKYAHSDSVPDLKFPMHGACVRLTSHLSECLHLHCAHERNKCVCQHVKALGNICHKEKHNYLANENQLPPMDFLVIFKLDVNLFRYENSQKTR